MAEKQDKSYDAYASLLKSLGEEIDFDGKADILREIEAIEDKDEQISRINSIIAEEIEKDLPNLNVLEWCYDIIDDIENSKKEE